MPAGNVSTTITPSPDKSSGTPRRRLGGLLQSRMCIVPTWRGWALLLFFMAFLVLVVGRQLCAFLTINEPVTGGVLVVEGWVPPYAIGATLDEFHRHPYLGIYTTGVPMEDGNPKGYNNYADFTAARLAEAGAPANSLHSVPAPFSGRDRTYTMAFVLKKRLEADGISTAKINIISVGSHSRRSRLLYRFAFGPGSKIGIIGLSEQEFDPKHWWRSSDGFRTVIGEAIAYVYARFLFRPSTP